MSKKFLDLKFNQDFVDSLPGDPLMENKRREVLNACYSFVKPTAVSSPRLVAWSRALSEALGITEPEDQDHEKMAQVLAGNFLLSGMRPYSACYGGHQFGHWAGQLGDGRAITLGEFRDHAGKSWELQLKGAGPTPYSRGADGRAVLRSSLREFLCSEVMHGLGVPTTRALSLVTTGEDVVRDMFYDGRPAAEPGAITSRVAPTFLRFGNFQILSARGEYENLKKLADFSISRHFPEFASQNNFSYDRWFAEICRRTAQLMVDWQRVGFVHGVMNTDNMSILGLTIDYGPYGWLEGFDPHWTPNTTDAAGRRYCYGRQPQIAYWNLQRFAESLLPLFGTSEGVSLIEKGLEQYVSTFNRGYFEAFANKLGLKRCKDQHDETLITDLLELLSDVETDMTIFFRQLANLDLSTIGPQTTWSDLSAVYGAFYNLSAVSPAHQHQLLDWMRRYARRFTDEGSDSQEKSRLMNQVNPKFVFRNYLAQEAIDDLATGSTAKIEQILARSKAPYLDQTGDDALCGPRPEWARFKPGCSALSCSS
jgi:uncharacterized protein YdiU (UPF0061 family)